MSIIAKITIALTALMPLALHGHVSHVPDFEYHKMFENDKELRDEFFSIVKSDITPSPYEKLLLTRLRNKDSSIAEFRVASKRLSYSVLQKVINCMQIEENWIQTSLALTKGYVLNQHVELVTIMRSGDIFINAFIDHFPNSGVSKYLIQRDEETSKPLFKYRKLSSTLNRADTVIILEPLVATGGTLAMAIIDLDIQGIKEDQIIIASLIASPEAIAYLSKRFPEIRLVTCSVDEKVNDRKFIVPGLGDFGDRYYGTD